MCGPDVRTRCADRPRRPRLVHAVTPTRPPALPTTPLAVRESCVSHPSGSVGLLKQPSQSREPADFVRGVILENDDTLKIMGEEASYLHIRSSFGGHEGYLRPVYVRLDGPSVSPPAECGDVSAVMRCGQCRDVLSDGSQCMCSC